MKVLVAIASYGRSNDQYLSALVNEYKSMSFEVDIIVFSNLRKYVAPWVEVVVSGPGEHPCALPFAHKQVFADRLEDYDLFIYSEDDTLLRQQNIEAFLEVSNVLPENEVAGFIRFEETADGDLNYPDVHGSYHWIPGSARLRGEYTLAAFTNAHAACYILMREQLRRAIDSGGFLVAPHGSRYDLVCTAATDPYTQCGFEKLVCISHLDRFRVQHLSNKYVGTTFGVSGGVLLRQLNALMRAARDDNQSVSLFKTETNLPSGWYSKCYYEPAHVDAISAIPGATRTVLSLGCGWGVTEVALAAKGFSVTAVPLDSVIPNGVESKGVEIISGNLDEARSKLADRQFDCVLLLNVLHLVPDPVELLSSYRSLLSPCGAFVAVVPNTGRLATAWKALLSNWRPARMATAWDMLVSPGKATTLLGRNGSRPASARKLVCNEQRAMKPGFYEITGVHLTSQKTFRSWFRSAGMRVESLIHVLSPRQQEIGRFALFFLSHFPSLRLRLLKRLLPSWLAPEFVVVATKSGLGDEDSLKIEAVNQGIRSHSHAVQ